MALYFYFFGIFFLWWGGGFSVFPWENLYFRYVSRGKPFILSLYFKSKNFHFHLIFFLFVLTGNFYFLDVFRRKRVFSLLVFIGIEGKMVGTERKKDITQERRKERNKYKTNGKTKNERSE